MQLLIDCKILVYFYEHDLFIPSNSENTSYWQKWTSDL